MLLTTKKQLSINLTLIAFFVLLLYCLASVSCKRSQRAELEPFSSDPLITVGHGVFIGADGKALIPTAEFIERAQKYYVGVLLKHAATLQGKTNFSLDVIQKTQKRIDELVEDGILARALFIDWIIEKTQPEDVAHITMNNNALRWYYVLHLQQQPVPAAKDQWTKGIKPEIATQLDNEGVQVTVFLITSAGGAAYVQECRDSGVPVPNAMFSDEWDRERRGVIFTGEFLDEKQAELWSFTSTSPEGVCLALPRYAVSGDRASDQALPLGIICLGTRTNKACFFDNPNGREFTRNREVSINEFRGGVDLVLNGQGKCTDCHAGENPFIVHPDKPAFEDFRAFGTGWYEPLVSAMWTQNVGPTVLLDAIPPGPAGPGEFPGACTDCHQFGNGGRFPEVSTELPGYCETVLKAAAGRRGLTPPGPNTMPRPQGSDTRTYANHIDALLRACTAPSSRTGVTVQVNYPDDNAYVSPPIVIDPLYQCATKVAVRGAILDARVELFKNGNPTPIATVMRARNPDKVELDVPDLRAGDVITATQEIGGVRSGPSAPVTVRDHRADYPSGLPAPQINPTLIYQCADTIAVQHVPGATVTVKTNGGNEVVGVTSTGWSVFQPGLRPFEIGYRFSARAELCGDPSPESAEERAVAAPGGLPNPTFNPGTFYAGQQLVTVESLINGSHTSISAGARGRIGEFSWPVSWFPNFDIAIRLGRPLAAGEGLVANQRLCRATGETQMQSAPAEECSALPAPRIRVPLVGDNYVAVIEAVPGARIRIYDNANVELGDGSGTVIILRRPLTGADTITVVQQVGECNSAMGFRVAVHNPG